jgi:TolA-binding protein
MTMRHLAFPGLLATLGCLSALGLAACGGGVQADAKTPDEATAEARRVDPAGPPAAQSSAPAAGAVRSSAAAAPARPSMNAVAAEAYRAGLQSFQGGDLQGAKTQFSRAANADPGASAALYSLGVVQ